MPSRACLERVTLRRLRLSPITQWVDAAVGHVEDVPSEPEVLYRLLGENDLISQASKKGYLPEHCICIDCTLHGDDVKNRAVLIWGVRWQRNGALVVNTH